VRRKLNHFDGFHLRIALNYRSLERSTYTRTLNQLSEPVLHSAQSHKCNPSDCISSVAPLIVVPPAALVASLVTYITRFNVRTQ
jgi:hypothetical protein